MKTTRKRKAHLSCTYSTFLYLSETYVILRRGQFTDDIGEDFLGLRELGIAAEFGLSSLSVPKRLLKGKRNAKGPNAAYGIPSSAIISFLRYYHSAKSAEPPPPYPPPQPFVPLTSESVKNQIGLLRGYFERRLAGLDSLANDPPHPAQAKLGPLGQVIRPSSAAMAGGGGSKKKAKPKDGTAGAAAASAVTTPAAGVFAAPPPAATAAGTSVTGVSVGVMSGVVAGVVQPVTPLLSSAGLLSPPAPPSVTAMVATTTISSGEAQPLTPKKKKAATGAGSGTGGTGKKRGRPPEGLPPVVVASA